MLFAQHAIIHCEKALRDEVVLGAAFADRVERITKKSCAVVVQMWRRTLDARGSLDFTLKRAEQHVAQH